MTSERMLDWVDGVASSLVRRAARRAPEALSERLTEEWLADLLERSGRCSRLCFAVGCCWATSVIVQDHGCATIPAASAAGGYGQLIGYTPQDSPLLSRRAVTFLLVAGLHVAAFFALASGLGSAIRPMILKPLVMRSLPSLPRAKLPPPPHPTITPTKLDIPLLGELPPIDSDASMPIWEDVVKQPPVEPHRADHSLPKRIQGGPGTGFPSAEDFYPSSAIRREESGVATVKACVDIQGRLTADPALIQSTGSARLDEAAVKLAIAGSGHYRPSTEDGQPVSACYPFRIRFDLKN